MSPITKFAGVIQNLPGDVDEITGTTTGLVTTSDSRADHVPHVVLPQGVGSAVHFSNRTVAALYVETGGTYSKLPGVDAWDITRDARKYSGPHPVVAHPPCQRWGRFWGGNPMQQPRLKLGDDQGCFAAALSAVRTWGGILEHPEASHAWPHFGLNKPPKSGGWVAADFEGGWTCCVEQGHYGHLSRKATWLYGFGVELPELIWGPARNKLRVAGAGFHTKAERDAAKAAGTASRTQLPVKLRNATPEPFRDLLLSIARSAQSLNNAPGNEAERLCLPALVSPSVHSQRITEEAQHDHG